MLRTLDMVTLTEISVEDVDDESAKRASWNVIHVFLYESQHDLQNVQHLTIERALSNKQINLLAQKLIVRPNHLPCGI
jgi:hypothetical protein